MTCYAYHPTSLFSLADVGRGCILSIGNLSKEKYNWKGKCEVIEHDRSQLQNKVLVLQEEMDKLKSL